MRFWLLVAVVVLLTSQAVLGQLASGASPLPHEYTPTTVYLHPIHPFDMPINTQTPTKLGEMMHLGATTSTATCAAPLAGSLAGVANEYHTYRGYSTSGFVAYGIVENGVPRVHPTRGLGANIFVAEGSAFLSWYFALEASGMSPTSMPRPIATAAPSVVVQATIRAGDPISLDDKAYDTGPILLQGETAPATLVAGYAIGNDGQPSPHVRGFTVNGRTVYEFKVPLQTSGPPLPNSTGYTLRIDAFVANPACAGPSGSGSVMPNVVSPYWAPAHLPRIEWHTSPALLLEQSLSVRPASGGLSFNWSYNSPWGNYDANASQEQLTVTGPQGDVPVTRTALVQRLHEHFHLNDPVHSGWFWNFSEQAPADGLYRAHVSVPNLQGTALLESHIEFRLRDGVLTTAGDRAIPASNLPAIILVLTLAGLILGLQRRS
jgi:hypothetical protein